MGILVLTFGDPVTGASIQRLSVELVYATGRFLDFETATISNADTLVLALTAVSPARGGPLRNRTSFKRGQREFWSSFAIEYEAYVEGDGASKVNAMLAALMGATDQIPDLRFAAHRRSELKEALAAGAQLLLSDSDRLRPFARRLL